MSTADVNKAALAAAVADMVQDGQTIGLGSGSTTEVALLRIAERIAAERITVFGVATSLRTAQLATQAGIQLLDIRTVDSLDWAFDGADEVDPALNLIKGRGAAMLMEKLVAARAKRFVVLVTEEKLVEHLGERMALPVEVLPEAIPLVEKAFATLGAVEIVQRQATGKYGAVVSEQGNIIYDLRFSTISPQLHESLSALPGVIETGLFFDYAPEVLVATDQKVQRLQYVGSAVERAPL